MNGKTLQEIEILAKDCGLYACVPLDVKTLECLPAVRDMCRDNKCGKYGKSWSCPPGCGSLEELEGKLKSYSSGILVQTVSKLKSSFDWNGMVAAGELHKEQQEKLRRELQKDYPGLLTLGAGTCSRCKSCTYPDEPCRFPELMTVSMEACGLFVSRICKANGLPYNYGENTVCYTGCFLLE